MTELWPRLPTAVASRIYLDAAKGDVPVASTDHPDQIWSPVGARATPKQILRLRDDLTALAAEFGFPQEAGPQRRIDFDRAAAPVMRKHLDLDWAEAGEREVWSFLALIALPDLTVWRFGLENDERWIASDLTRHAWARLWWQALVFEGAEDVLRELGESDLNQLLERRSIGGDPRLVRALGRAVVEAPAYLQRRVLIRDATQRLRRRLAFLEVRSLSNDQLLAMCREIILEHR